MKKLQYLAPVALTLACSPQRGPTKSPEKRAISCRPEFDELDERITCIKKAIHQTGTLEDAQSFCEGSPLMLCQLDVMQKYSDDARLQQDPLSACSSPADESGKRTVELQCLFSNFSVMSEVQSDIHADLRACNEDVLLCYERVYSQLP